MDFKIFKIIFLQEKKKFFDQFFFLAQVMWGLQGFMLRVVWESQCRAPPPDLLKSVQLHTFFWKAFHMREVILRGSIQGVNSVSAVYGVYTMTWDPYEAIKKD